MKAAEFLRNYILTFTIENDIDVSITWHPTVYFWRSGNLLQCFVTSSVIF